MVEGVVIGGRTGARAALAAVVALLVVLACSQGGSPVAPEDGPATVGGLGALAGDEVSGFSTDGVVMFLVPPDPALPRSVGKRIRAKQGGEIELQGFRVKIPPRALARDTYVTIDLPTTLPESQYVVADFGPSGTRFRKPVTVTLPLSSTDALPAELSSIGVWYWTGSAWQSYGGTASKASVSTTTDHFSTYGARRSGGIDTTSGG